MAKDDEHPRFKESTVHEILKTAFKGEAEPKVSGPALALTAEYIRLFTLEAIHRSAKTAKDEQAKRKPGESAQVDVEHLQANAAGLTLDFGG